ncbi:unnamed protein product [Blepharisma stoltei]|uniref:Uncharacterized protein n=1 Tax=Blepharisma stoltei TaxID=1481888 RepID=A0AAU9ISV2_9CILI|nr:unnamed protein product [Blepharisma stoltei]
MESKNCKSSFKLFSLEKLTEFWCPQKCYLEIYSISWTILWLSQKQLFKSWTNLIPKNIKGCNYILK